jgi:hypothetical protein
LSTTIGASANQGETNLHPQGSTTLTLKSTGEEKEQKTKATIGSGNIVIDGQEATNKQLGGLNRDIEKRQSEVREKITGTLDGTISVDNRLIYGYKKKVVTDKEGNPIYEREDGTIKLDEEGNKIQATMNGYQELWNELTFGWATATGRNWLNNNNLEDFPESGVIGDNEEQKINGNYKEKLGEDWIQVSKEEAIYHQYADDKDKGNIKYVNGITGKEVIYDKDGDLVTNPKIYGTYNYAVAVHPENNKDIVGWGKFILSSPGHVLFDMLPYYIETGVNKILKKGPYYPPTPISNKN